MTNSHRLAAVIVVALAATAFAQSDAQKSFMQLKSLAGAWEGKTADGKPLQVSFRETAGGSALLSEIQGGHGMISMIHLDGPNKLLMTHYCAAGNEPRMEATVSPDGKTITFTFFDGTNIAPDAGHMQSMVLTMVDSNHHTENWTFVAQGKETKQFFDLYRKI